jgi:hypothetical protein
MTDNIFMLALAYDACRPMTGVESGPVGNRPGVVECEGGVGGGAGWGGVGCKDMILLVTTAVVHTTTVVGSTPCGGTNSRESNLHGLIVFGVGGLL